MNLAEVMQLCSLGMRTGRIEYKHQEEQGRIYCEKGVVVHADFRFRYGQDAAVDMLLQQDSEADFFEEDISSIPHSVSISCTHLLLESARILDESRDAQRRPFSLKYHRLTLLNEEQPPLILEITQDGQQLGRQEDNAFLVAHHTISRHHCIFHVRENEVLVSDLNSTNGTYINDVPAQETPLKANDLLRVGELYFRYELFSHSPSETPEPPQIHKVPLHQTTLIPSPFRLRQNS